MDDHRDRYAAYIKSLEALVMKLSEENDGLRRQRDELQETTGRYWNWIIDLQSKMRRMMHFADLGLTAAHDASHGGYPHVRKRGAVKAHNFFGRILYGPVIDKWPDTGLLRHRCTWMRDCHFSPAVDRFGGWYDDQKHTGVDE
jgi:hypothetical protein